MVADSQNRKNTLKQLIYERMFIEYFILIFSGILIGIIVIIGTILLTEDWNNLGWIERIFHVVFLIVFSFGAWHTFKLARRKNRNWKDLVETS